MYCCVCRSSGEKLGEKDVDTTENEDQEEESVAKETGDDDEVQPQLEEDECIIEDFDDWRLEYLELEHVV